MLESQSLGESERGLQLAVGLYKWLIVLNNPRYFCLVVGALAEPHIVRAYSPEVLKLEGLVERSLHSHVLALHIIIALQLTHVSWL